MIFVSIIIWRRRIITLYEHSPTSVDEFQNNIWILNCNLMKNLDIACKIAKIEKIKVIEIVQNNKSKRIESIN